MTSGPVDQPTRLAHLAEYQPGAVVSRVILKTPTGTVTVFAFDAGEGLTEHTTPSDALVHVMEGEASITIAGVTHTVASGEILRLPGGVPHAVKATTRFKMLLVMVKA